MVITVMSTVDEPESGDTQQTDELTHIKEKLKVQQRLIDISLRNLQSTRLSSSSRSNAVQQHHGGSLLHSTNNGYVSGGEVQSSILEDNLREKEAKLMRGFSRQLLLKHQHLKSIEGEGGKNSLLEEVSKQLDELISLEQFLVVTGIESKSIKALLSGDNLTLDMLFSRADREQLFTMEDISAQDRSRLTKYLDQLLRCYESWEHKETHSLISGVATERYNSTTSRLSSVGSIDQDGGRNDSVSSCTSAGNSPRALRASTSHTPTPITPLSAHTPTPITPSSSHSLLSLTAFTYSTPLVSGTYEFVSTPQTPNSASSQQCPQGLNRAHSSSSSVLLESPPPSLSQNSQQLDPPQLSQPAAHRRSLFSHKRSKSNPPAHSVSQDDEVKDEPVYHSGTPGPYINSWNCSSSPPSRVGSNPSITSHSIYGPSGSPSAIPRNRHPQMRRISAMTPGFSQSISNDQPVTNKKSSLVMSGSESVLCRQNTCPESEQDLHHRSYSLASMEPGRRSVASALYPDGASLSMVDLPVTMHAISSEHLDQIDEYGRPDTNKSRSVPRLTFMTISTESDRGLPSTSAPTSPRTPGTYTPTGHMGHAIRHRFTTRSFITAQQCDVCKKMVMIGVRCKHCKFKCHKNCSKNAPPSCGLPDGLMEFVRKQVILTASPSPSMDNFTSPVEPHQVRPILSHTGGSLDTMDSPDSSGFIIHELSKEPSASIHYSPVMGPKKNHLENGRQRNELFSQTSTSSLLEVPNQRIPSAYRSTSSSPSITPPTSPSLTPSSPRSPMDSGIPTGFPSSPIRSEHIRVVLTDESGDESYEDHMSPFSSHDGSTNDISDVSRVETPQGVRPPPQVVLAQSLPDLLNLEPSDQQHLLDSRGSTDESNGYFSDDILGGGRRPAKRKESLVGTLSTGDSKTSTLVNSNLTEEEDDYESDFEEDEYRYSRTHRPSVIDEWNIPFNDIRKMELLSKGPMVEVYKGYWHGEVAIKKFILPDATPDQIARFKEEVSILKKTRHENLALFMGASLTSPDLAIVTSFCKGHTLYKKIHVWNESTSIERNLNLVNQVAQALGYLHARSIVAKDLTSKNIFVEKEKVVITDTGLSNLTDNYWLQQPEMESNRQYIVVPRTKLYYLAPELIQVLSLCPSPLENGDYYPYSEKTDVYAFGVILHELFVRRFPFSTDIYGFSLDPMSLVFQVGRGRRPDIQGRDIPKRIKALMLDCMHPDPRSRFPFSTISEALVKLSRKKTPISRSPSFPTNLSRSSETINFL